MYRRDMQELISLVINENESYRTEVYRLRQELIMMHEMLRNREYELTNAVQEHNFVAESEMNRVIKEHRDTVVSQLSHDGY